MRKPWHKEAVPIKIRGQTRAVLLYGETRLEGEHDEALRHHEHAVTALGLSTGQAAELRQHLLNVKLTLPST